MDNSKVDEVMKWWEYKYIVGGIVNKDKYFGKFLGNIYGSLVCDYIRF